jgi:hypothetical protein
MLSKCANPACSSTFLYLHEGRIFRLELNHPAVDRHSPPRRSFEYFWLCSECAPSLTVAFENQKVTVRPLPGPRPSRERPSPALDEDKVA